MIIKCCIRIRIVSIHIKYYVKVQLQNFFKETIQQLLFITCIYNNITEYLYMQHVQTYAASFFLFLPPPRIAQNIHFVQLLSTQKKQSRHIGFIPTLKEPLLSPFLFNRHNPDAFGRFNAPQDNGQTLRQGLCRIKETDMALFYYDYRKITRFSG